MSNFNERHPPMGSEKDIDSQATTNTSGRIARSSSSSSEELDELSLRVRALLAESDDELITEFPSHKESPVYQESQVSPVSSETESDTQASCSSVNLECHPHVDKVILPKKERQQVTESLGTLKDSPSKIDYNVYDVHKTLSYSYSSEVFERKKVSFEDHTERYMPEDLFSSSGVAIIEDSHSNRHQPSVSSVTSHKELETSNDSTSYYTLDDDLEKQTIDYHLKGMCCGAKLPLLDTSFSTNSQLFYYTPCENKEKLYVDKKSDIFSYSSARFSPQQTHDKEEKECPSWSRVSDCDTPSLSVSSIASSKRLEWDNAADIGYTRDTVAESSSQRKSRKEPEGFSLAAHKLSYGTSSKYSASANQQLSAKDTSIFSEREHTPQVFQTPNINEKSHVSEDLYVKIDYPKKDKSDKKDKRLTEETSGYESALPFIDFETTISLQMEPELQIRSDSSVRPKTYVKKDKDSERKIVSPKDPETNTTYLKERESEFAESDFIESIHQNRDSEMLKKRVSFASSKTYEGNVKIVGFMKPVGDNTITRSFEPHSCQPISDLPEEYQKHILSTPIFIDSEMLTSEYNAPTADNPISSSEVLPHIRWYPIPSYKSSQDIRNATTQTSVRHSKEAGTSSEMCNELDESFIDSSDVVQHLHLRKIIDKDPVNCFIPLQDSEAVNLTPEYASEYIDHSGMKQYSSMSNEAHETNEFITSQIHNKLIQNVNPDDVIRHLHMKRILDRNALNTCHVPSQEINYRNLEDMDFKNVVGGIERDEYDMKHDVVTSVLQYNSEEEEADSPGIFVDNEKDKQEFTFDNSGKVLKDASTQVKNCDCFNEFKNMIKKALDKVPDEHVCPFHKVLKKKLEKRGQTKRASLHSETYDVLFLGDDMQKVLDAENSPLCFSNILMSPLRHVRKRKCAKSLTQKEKQKRNKEIKLMEEKKKVLRIVYRNHAKKFSEQLAKNTVKGKVDYIRHERVLKKSPFY